MTSSVSSIDSNKPNSVATLAVPAGTVLVDQTKTAAIPKQRFNKRLEKDQALRLASVLDPKKEIILPSKSNDPNQAIKFTLYKLLEPLTRELRAKGIITEPPCLTGGAAGHVLTGLEYADIDINFVIEKKSFYKIKGFLQEFIAKELNKPLDENLKKFIDENYLYNKKRGANSSYIGLGGLELKFINGTETRWHVSTSERIQIPLFLNSKSSSVTGISAFCMGTEKDYDDSIDALKFREFIVNDHEHVDDLIFRLLHKTTQGFEIPSSDQRNAIHKCAISQFLTQFPLNKPDMFKDKVLKQLKSHYLDNDLGKMIYCLNFLKMLMHIEQPEIRNEYCKLLAEVIESSKIPYLQSVAMLLKNDPGCANDIISYIQGIFLLDTISSNEMVEGYPVTFSKHPNVPRLHFAYAHQKGVQYLEINHNPLELAERFFTSWRNLEERCAKTKLVTELENVSQELGLNLNPFSINSQMIASLSSFFRYLENE